MQKLKRIIFVIYKNAFVIIKIYDCNPDLNSIHRFMCNDVENIQQFNFLIDDFL